MNIHTWLHELSFVEDTTLRKLLREGITNGFFIVDQHVEIDEYFCRNFSSTLEG